jgi:hypothetical protein
MKLVRVRLLVTAAVLMLVAVACAESDDSAATSTVNTGAIATTTAIPTPTVVPTPTLAPQRTTTTAEVTTTAPSTTTSAPPETDEIGLLAAHANGIDLRFGEDIVTVLEGTPVSAAFADGLGGVVYQREIPGDRPMWDWGPDLTEPVLVWHDGGPIERPIMWMPSLGSPPHVLVTDDDESWIELVDVTTLGDRQVVIYEREVSLVDSCVGLDDFTHCYFESLRTRLTARDLETGQEWPLGRSGSFEWGAQASIAASQAAVNLSNADHGAPAAMVLADVSAMLALDQDARITSVTSDDMTTIALAEPCATSSYCDDNPGIAALSASAISRDGSSLAFLEYYHSCCGRSPNDTELVIWDLEQGRETLRIHLGQNQWATWIDHNGADTLLGLYPNNSILVDADGVTIALPAGPRYSFWDQ